MINLLPPEIKTRHNARSKLFSIIVLYIIIIAIFILGPLAGITYNFVQSSQISSVESQIANVKSQIGESKNINQKLAFLESRVALASQLKEQKDWTDYLEIISSATPSLVVVSTINLQEQTESTPTFTVIGKSNDRRSVVLYKDKLLENELVNQATFTTLTESVEQEVKSFSFTLSIIFTK